jgi:hypothetical protein
MYKFLLPFLFISCLISGCSNQEMSAPKPHPFGHAAAAQATVNYAEFYSMEVPENFKKVNVPKLNNAFNLYPNRKLKDLYNKCTMQVLSDLYQSAPTLTRKQKILHDAIDTSRNFVLTTTLEQKELAISKIDEITINNLHGYTYGISSHNPDKFFHSVHYVLINPDDIGVIYASIVALDKKSADKCIKESSKAIESLRYAPLVEVY